MMKIAVFLTVSFAAISASSVFAQSAPVRGVGLLALNATDSHGSAANAGSSRTMQIEVPDSGGGGHSGLRALRGAGDSSSAHDGAEASSIDSAPAAAPVVPGDPTTPTAPKRTNYRWQALVPGAIK